MQPSILIVEDHDIVRRSLRDWLSVSFRDYRVIEAKTAEEGIALTRTAAPALVLMDIGLPQMNGIDATREIKRAAPAIPVVVLSIHESPQYQTDALSAGANAYVCKRKLYDELFSVLARLLNDDSSKTLSAASSAGN